MARNPRFTAPFTPAAAGPAEGSDGNGYAYEHFRRRMMAEDAGFHGGPRAGEPMPDFDLPTSDGKRLRKGDFVGRKPLLLTFGSFT